MVENQEQISLPDWFEGGDILNHSEGRVYKGGFWRKSSLSFIRLLGKIQRSDEQRNEWTMETSLGLFYTLAVVVMIALSKETASLYFWSGVILVCLALSKEEIIRRVLGGAIPVVLLTVLMVTPAAVMGKTWFPYLLCLRVFLSVTQLGLLIQQTRWSRMTSALKKLYVPDLVLFLIEVTMQYIVVLGKEALELFWAVNCRNVGKESERKQSLGNVAGVLFLKSRDMSDLLYQAMVCRGFTGSYYRGKHQRFTKKEAGVVFLTMGLGLVWLKMEGIWS